MANLLLTKKDRVWCSMAESIAKSWDPNIQIIRGNSGDPLPDLENYNGEFLLSFLCPWVVPWSVLDRFRIPINFHPAPPDYRGYGPYNFALYEDAKDYGITIHRMTAELDSGPIYEVRRFQILNDDTVLSLQHRAIGVLLGAFYDTMYRGLPILSEERWSAVKHTKKELDALMHIPVGASDSEVKRRKRAFDYPGWRVE